MTTPPPPPSESTSSAEHWAKPVERLKVSEWKQHFPEFQPPENRFLPSLAGVKPGDVLFIEAMLPAWPGSQWGFPVSAGALVLYADDEMFNDPIYEFGFRYIIRTFFYKLAAPLWWLPGLFKR